jgi:hypothetical protein
MVPRDGPVVVFGRGHLALAQHHTPQPRHRRSRTNPFDPPPLNSMRRPASASRTYGRYAVALRAIPDSAAYLDAPTGSRRTAERKINSKGGVDRPRSFRDDQRGNGEAQHPPSVSVRRRRSRYGSVHGTLTEHRGVSVKDETAGYRSELSILQAEFSLTQVLADPATGRTGLVQDAARPLCHRDNFATHRAPAVRAWAAADDVELVFLPTYSSWLN